MLLLVFLIVGVAGLHLAGTELQVWCSDGFVQGVAVLEHKRDMQRESSLYDHEEWHRIFYFREEKNCYVPLEVGFDFGELHKTIKICRYWGVLVDCSSRSCYINALRSEFCSYYHHFELEVYNFPGNLKNSTYDVVFEWDLLKDSLGAGKQNV